MSGETDFHRRSFLRGERIDRFDLLNGYQKVVRAVETVEPRYSGLKARTDKTTVRELNIFINIINAFLLLRYNLHVLFNKLKLDNIDQTKPSS